MNILFLTVSRINDLTDRGIYTDLMRKFAIEGHNVFIVTPLERRYRQRTEMVKTGTISLLKIHTLNFQKASLFEKFFSVQLINSLYKRGISKFFKGIKFDLVLYSTPPITFTRLVRYFKSMHSSVSYLLLKDIFPQNAVDLGYIKRHSPIHRYFMKKEQKLYEVSDFIGCMSAGNVDYLLRNNPGIPPAKVEINPNSHELFDISASESEQKLIREKLSIPAEAALFVFGGNLGKSQGVGFLIDILESELTRQGVFYLIIGSGTEYRNLRSWFNQRHPSNALLIPEMNKNDFNNTLKTCDVGMIFLDRRFTIPNFPSRLLSYLENSLPVIAAIDTATDLGRVIVDNGFGLWSESGDLDSFTRNAGLLSCDRELRKSMGKRGLKYMKDNFTVAKSYDTIIRHFQKN
jgi:glycosyltransferase involved in cell wall biosynthesis